MKRVLCTPNNEGYNAIPSMAGYLELFTTPSVFHWITFEFGPSKYRAILTDINRP